MPFSYEETALAFAQQFIRAQQAEAQVRELQAKLDKVEKLLEAKDGSGAD